MKYITNSFSLGMLPEGASPVVKTITVIEVMDECVDFGEASRRDYPPRLCGKSIVGHTDVAAIISGMLGTDVPMNRESISLSCGDVLFVAQYIGPRLPEGCTTLPEGASIKWLRVIIVDNVSRKLAEHAALSVSYCSDTDAMIKTAHSLWGDVWE